MSTYFVVGASRGIGFELVQQALKSTDATNKVIAGVRNPTSATALVELQKTYSSRLSIVRIDIESDQSVKDAAAQVSKTHSSIDYLVINGAIMGSKDLTAAQLLAVLNVNLAGPLRVILEFLPLVRKSQRKVVITVSSLAGCYTTQDMLLGYYHSLGAVDPLFYPYRTSKAALNFLTYAFAKDHKHEGIIFVPVHPGMVETDMFDETKAVRGEHNGAKSITPEESAKKQLELFHKLTIEDSGKFYGYTGELMPQ